MYHFQKPVKWLLISTLLSMSLYAQNSTRYVGRVVDAATTNGLPGASIVLMSSKRGTISDIVGTTTDEDGVFIVDLKTLGADSIEISYIGY